MRDFIKNIYLRVVQSEGTERAIEEATRRGATEEELAELQEGITDEFKKD
jgi:hypothetical protein